MDAKKIEDTRRRLSSEYENPIKSINRNRLAAKEIKLENTEDEDDLATISHERELLYNLHESDFDHLRFIQEAIPAMDRGQYGECVCCGEDINERRSVDTDDFKWIRKARKVFEQTGAADIAWTDELKNDYANTDRPKYPLSA
jgi:RNA polymerase-binding transcription factor DksA